MNMVSYIYILHLVAPSRFPAMPQNGIAMKRVFKNKRENSVGYLYNTFLRIFCCWLINGIYGIDLHQKLRFRFKT